MAPSGARAAMTTARIALALAAAAVALIAAVQLGNWQSRRAEEKRALERAWDAALTGAAHDVRNAGDAAAIAAQLPRRVRVRGEFMHQHTVWLDNRVLDGRAGFFVVTPLRLRDEAAFVLVNRGWAPRDLVDPARLPPVGRPLGTIELEGLAVGGVPRLLEFGRPGAVAGAPIRHNLDPEELRARLAAPLAPFVVQQLSPLDDGLVRKWAPPVAGVAKHRGYALQWYALAALIAVLTVVFGGRALRARLKKP